MLAKDEKITSKVVLKHKVMLFLFFFLFYLRQTDSVSVDRVPCTGKVALSGEDAFLWFSVTFSSPAISLSCFPMMRY